MRPSLGAPLPRPLPALAEVVLAEEIDSQHGLAAAPPALVHAIDCTGTLPSAPPGRGASSYAATSFVLGPFLRVHGRRDDSIDDVLRH